MLKLKSNAGAYLLTAKLDPVVQADILIIENALSSLYLKALNERSGKNHWVLRNHEDPPWSQIGALSEGWVGTPLEGGGC